MQYSEQENLVNSPELPDQEPAYHSLLITHTLLHDIILLEVTAYSLKYAANMKRKMLKRTEELNDLIEQKINSDATEDMDMVEVLKKLKMKEIWQLPGNTSLRCRWRGRSQGIFSVILIKKASKGAVRGVTCFGKEKRGQG